MSRVAKYASLAITLAGGLLHSYLTLQLAVTWRTLRALDAENELDAWKLDGLKVLWALLAVYLQAAAFISFVGFSGVVRNKPSQLRIYRDYSFADLAFSAFLTVILFAFALAPTFSRDATATFRIACEELARQPELAQLLLMLSPDETCERWLERAALGAAVGMAVLTCCPSTLPPCRRIALPVHVHGATRSVVGPTEHPFTAATAARACVGSRLCTRTLSSGESPVCCCGVLGACPGVWIGGWHVGDGIGVAGSQRRAEQARVALTGCPYP
ncbi:hypothetical protein FB45DRAFT_872888 [Roridomyces roridus]|uniref:Uncharacterized protein n=1 Tax=Roridomyces roridus TaxID=1738132 RepID=A0AAD7BBV5_9AGAR|nr:hypothetical protein FB45DRAFT_872888 [Roridomyces roridus]